MGEGDNTGLGQDFARLFSARPKDQCAGWFTRVLGFQVFGEVAGVGWRGVFLLHADSGTVINFQLHDRNQGDESCPRRTGLTISGSRSGVRRSLSSGMSSWTRWASTTPRLLTVALGWFSRSGTLTGVSSKCSAAPITDSRDPETFRGGDRR